MMYVYAFKGDRTFAARIADHHDAGGNITYLKLKGWRVFWRVIS